MSTRASVSFTDGTNVRACVYLHNNGRPETVLRDLQYFLTDVALQAEDTRFDHPDYLAARYVVWQAAQNQRGPHRLNFQSVGVMLPGAVGVNHEYFVACTDRDARPVVTQEG